MTTPCSTTAATRFIDQLQPFLPLVFPTVEEVQHDQEQYAATDPFGLGHGFDFDDFNDYGGPLSDAEFRLRTTLHECNFCDEFVSAQCLDSDVQFVLTVSRSETGALSASIDFLRSYSYSSRGVMEYGDVPGRMRTNEIRQLFHVDTICSRCRHHLDSVEFPKVADSWSTLNVDNLSLAGGVVTNRERKRVRLEVKIEEPKALHALFEIPDLLGIIAEYANPLASVFSRSAPVAVSIGVKRALSA